MPEGPELFLSSAFINRICRDIIFSGKPQRNPIHKCFEINWNEPEYTISAESRGKELKVHLHRCRKGDKPNGDSLSIRFNFGMSGKFEFVLADSLPKHSHLTFFTKDDPKMALAFVDYRRFGKWLEKGDWSNDRGPCVFQEHSDFVKNVAMNQNSNAFEKPICEVMLNQKFFNGIGNYLRAEILFRCKVAPFEKARSVLYLNEKDESIKVHEKADIKNETKVELLQNGDHAKNMKIKEESKENIKKEVFEQVDCNGLSTKGCDSLSMKGQELLMLCGSVPLEVVDIGLKKESLSEMYVDDTSGSFSAWLKCYYQDGMKNLADHNNRTIWFSGPAGPMLPKEQKSRGKRTNKKKDKTTKDVKTLSPSDTTFPDKQGNQRKKRLTRNKVKEVKQVMTGKKESKQTNRVSTKNLVKSSKQSKRKSSSSVERAPVKKVKQDEHPTSASKRLTRSRLRAK